MERVLIESFPILSSNVELAAKDFIRFSRSYSEILKKHIPTIKNVEFVITVEQFVLYFQDNKKLGELKKLFEEVLAGVRPCAIHDQCLLLPFTTCDKESMVAILDSPDDLFRQKVCEDWLIESKSFVLHEFLLLKQVRVDTHTGLLNLSNLFYLLDTYSSTTNLHLILVELPPKRSSFKHVQRQSQKCSTLLLDFMQGDSVVHYLGQCTFALVLENSFKKNNREIERPLVAYLKRAGCHRVHVGSSFLENRNSSEHCSFNGRPLLDQAWTALQHAVKRGPFSFCDYSLLAYPEKRPLAPPDRNVVRRLSRLWACSDQFCLVLFRSDNDPATARNILQLVNIDLGRVVESGDDVLVYIDGVKKQEALEWAKAKIQLVDRGKNSGKATISAGVSCYPYFDFKKPETLLNCQKALLHAAFYGHASAAVFEAVSLNISGDIYFSDGDLAKAVKEYKRGLKCDGSDVNLHNSLGVALVMMDKLKPAMRCFEKALTIENKNFMALYNLGLGEQARDKNKKAYSYLEKALQHYTADDGGKELLDDLKLQLGILSCDIGKYESAETLLLPWFEEKKNNHRAGRVHYYLGKAYHGLKDNQKAMESLQRALRFNEFDDRAMNLLGKVYFEEREGDEIALSLCRKSVEIEPANIIYRQQLARVELRCGILEEARENIRRCLRSKEHKIEAQIDMARSYTQEGQFQKAKIWYRKVLVQENVRKRFFEEANEALVIP